jgi:hypothetical protein
VPLRLGTKKGYSNKIEPISTYPLAFSKSFKEGISTMIEYAKKHLDEKGNK